MERESYYNGTEEWTDKAMALLRQLIALPSLSGEEGSTADLLEQFFRDQRIHVRRLKNNVIVRNKNFESCKPTILLNSHHDTVKPAQSWKTDPFQPVMKDGKLFGLGSNDAGASLVSLIMVFMAFHEMTNMPFNLILVASAEEEISGRNGIELVLKELPEIDFAIVGEPTGMKMAVAEKGLVVLDCLARGKAGHAARDEGENAIYKAVRDIEWFRIFRFERISENLGEVKMTVTAIQAGSQHNVVPDRCDFVVDVRTTDAYTNEEIVEIIRSNVHSSITPRSVRLQPSGLPENHILLNAAQLLEIETFGSRTLSDMALMPFPAVKIGPGDSARSHTADEFIETDEIRSGIKVYIKLIDRLMELKLLPDKTGSIKD